MKGYEIWHPCRLTYSASHSDAQQPGSKKKQANAALQTMQTPMEPKHNSLPALLILCSGKELIVQLSIIKNEVAIVGNFF